MDVIIAQRNKMKKEWGGPTGGPSTAPLCEKKI